MKRLVIVFFAALLLAGALSAQVSGTIHVGTLTWNFVIPTTESKLQCDQASLAPGQSSTCTLTLDSAAPAGGFIVVPFTADAPLVLTPASLTVPAGTVSVMFTVTRPSPGRRSRRSSAA